MMLSEHFSLEELIRSDEALRLDVRNVPDDIEVDNLRRLCREILEPLRAAIGLPIRVTSGYRCQLLNTVVGGSQTSAHCDGRAADIKVEGMTPRQVCERIVALGLPFDQVIHEFGAWCHVGIAYAGAAPRGQTLTAVKAAGRTQYLQGIV